MTSSWLEANLAAHRRFPQVMWLPGFWTEFGMASNPPSFGAHTVWPEGGYPSCEPIFQDSSDIQHLQQPDVRSAGLLPQFVRQTRQCLPAIESAGHRIRFACSHGPVTIASTLWGHNEFFLACRTERDAVGQLLDITTQFVIDWLSCQREQFPSIDGVLVLEDLMGFVGEDDFVELILPRMQRIFTALPVSVRFLHNDAFGLITARYLTDMHVNLFNFSFEHPISEIRQLAGERVTLMGNIPPRDTLGLGSVADVRAGVRMLVESLSSERRLIISAGGFTPATFDAEKIEAFCAAVAQ